MLNVNILIVDDRPENLFSLETLIEADGRTIIKANSGSEALKLVLKYNFGLILSDVQMPEMDGFEMFEILRSNPKTKMIPMIFLTAINKDFKYALRGYTEGAVDYIFKPLDNDVVRTKVDVFVQLHRQKEILSEKNRELEETNKLKNQFMGMASHDLRNPLGVIEYYSHVLKEELGDKLSPEQLNYLQTIYDSSKFMYALVGEMLDIAQIESGKLDIKFSGIETSKYFQSIVVANSVYGEKKNINIVLNNKSARAYIIVDPQKMVQVMNNLLSNAVKYSHPSTTVTVNISDAGENLHVEVIDQGQGIPDQELGSIFNPFQKTSVQSTAGEKSTGLGLNIVQKIIEAHGGTIAVESTVGKGSKFFFEIPVKHYLADTISPAATKAVAVENVSKNILVADDDTVNQIMIKKILTDLGHKAVIAANGAEAIEILEKQEFDMVLMDVNMPVMDGIAATKAIVGHALSRVKKTPVVALTATSIDEEINNCLVAGAREYVSKPINMDKLKEIIAQF